MYLTLDNIFRLHQKDGMDYTRQVHKRLQQKLSIL